MYKLLLTSALFFGMALGEVPLKAEQCEQFTVTASDGYANIRSFPKVQRGNIVGTLPTGYTLSVNTKRQGWWQTNLPFQGWIAGNQVGKISCNKANELLYQLGYPTIKHLSQKSIKGDYIAADTLIKMSSAMDGAIAEVFSESITEFANQNPKFLISRLQEQSASSRQSTLQLIDFGLGVANSSKRQRFEKIINQLPLNNLIRQDWQNQKNCCSHLKSYHINITKIRIVGMLLQANHIILIKRRHLGTF